MLSLPANVECTISCQRLLHNQSREAFGAESEKVAFAESRGPRPSATVLHRSSEGVDKRRRDDFESLPCAKRLER